LIFDVLAQSLEQKKAQLRLFLITSFRSVEFHG
jgi:hypothetical protein